MNVDPIKNTEDLNNLKKYLQRSPRDFAIFTLAINTNLRASDFRRITIGQVTDIEPGDDIVLVEQKTGKQRRITINKAASDAINALLATMPTAKATEPLFQSRKGRKPLNVSSLSNLVKQWCDYCGLEGNFASHSLRKTFGYYHAQVFNTPIYLITKMFNHSSEATTLRYIGLQEEDVRQAYLKSI